MILRRNEVLLATFIGFVAWGLVVQWLPVLRYVGYAFAAGALCATFGLLGLALTTVRRATHGRPIAQARSAAVLFLSPEAWRVEASQFVSSRVYQPEQLYPPSFMISDGLDELLNSASRDFVKSWYGNINKDSTFANEVDRGIRVALARIRDHVLREDVVNVIISRIVPLITAHMRDFDQAERVVRGRSLNRNFTDSEELDLAIASKYRDGRLHPAASLAFSDTRHIQQEHLRKALVRLLPDLLPESMMKSRIVSVLIKEIVACAVLFPLTQILSDPDTWNQLIEAYGRETLQDRKTVRKLRAALDEHASADVATRQTQEVPRLAPTDSERSFERFVRAIRRTNNLSDARRFRSQVASQLTRESLVEGQDATYLRRLETGKRVLDQKVARLSTKGGSAPRAAQRTRSTDNTAAITRDTNLVEIMHTSSGLSYFMEFMDRQRLMSLVQFWVVVDGFRDPLEDDFGDEEPSANPLAWNDTDRTDIAQISETYMSKTELKVPQESRDSITGFLRAGRKASPAQYQQARTAILTAQSATLDELQTLHFPNFKKSDLYYKYLASDEASNVVKHDSDSGIEIHRRTKEGDTDLQRRPKLKINAQQPFSRSQDLRRAALSSSDLRSSSMSNLTDASDSARRSVDSDRNTPLFDDEYDTDPLANSTYSLGHDSQNGEGPAPNRVIESMEAALNDIITEDPDQGLFEEPKSHSSDLPASSHKAIKPAHSPMDSLDFAPIEGPTGEKGRPSLATLGLVNTSSRIGVFSDDDLFPDEEKFLEDEYTDLEAAAPGAVAEEEIHEAAPGDLGLTEAITSLSREIEKLVAQESVVDTLTRKAELTNNIAELRILGKSKASLQREIRRKELQRQQYVVQESDNSLYGRSFIRIKSVMVGRESDGREFAVYLIEVQRKAGEQMPAASWAVARRYSEFHMLYQRLRMRYPSTRTLEFPRRRMVMKLQKDFLHKRRNMLEAYLRELLQRPDVCRSQELRSFLSQQAVMPHSDANRDSDTQDIVTRIYNSVTDGMDDFFGNVAVLDQLSAAGQNLISAATNQLAAVQSGAPVNVNGTGSIAEAEAELSAFEDRELEPFVKPICDIFLEMFELNRGNNWLRGRAVVVVLHQLLGGAIERKVRDSVRTFSQEDSVVKYIGMIKQTMWPGGKLRESQPRTPVEKTNSKKEAGVILATLIPDMAANVVGRANAQAAARRIHATMNNERLNKHLAFTVLDELIAVFFGNDTRSR